MASSVRSPLSPKRLTSRERTPTGPTSRFIRYRTKTMMTATITRKVIRTMLFISACAALWIRIIGTSTPITAASSPSLVSTGTSADML